MKPKETKSNKKSFGYPKPCPNLPPHDRNSIDLITSPLNEAAAIERTSLMGARHATLRPSRGPIPQESSVAQLPRSSSFAERLLPRCLMPENSRECDDDDDDVEEDRGAEQGEKGRRLPTLEEWLLASPGVDVQQQLHRRQSPKVCPLSTPSVVRSDRHFTGGVDASTPSASSFSRSESGRRRRVSFRLPAAGDIIVISSTTDCESN